MTCGLARQRLVLYSVFNVISNNRSLVGSSEGLVLSRTTDYWLTKQMFSVSFQVIIYCDLHGHSRKPNVFMYGCTADPKMASMSNFVEERLFPWMMSQKVMITT